MEITFENVRDIIVETLSCDAEDVKLDTNLIIFNVVLIGASFIFGYVRSKTVHPEPSYEVM